jgi:hypothetical protein
MLDPVFLQERHQAGDGVFFHKAFLQSSKMPFMTGGTKESLFFCQRIKGIVHDYLLICSK